MNRMNFIKGIAASSAGLFLPALLFRKYKNSEPATKLHFVGLGAAGGNFLNYIYKKEIVARYTYIDKQPKQNPCPANRNFIKYCPEQNTQIASLIQTNFMEGETIVLLAGLGGKTGSNLSAALFGHLQTARRDVFLVATIPFDFEGKRQRNAHYAAYRLKAMGKQKNIAIIENQECFERFDNLQFFKAVEKMDEVVCFEVIKLLNKIEKTNT